MKKTSILHNTALLSLLVSAALGASALAADPAGLEAVPTPRAPQPSPVPGDDTYATLTNLQSATAIMKARVELAEQQKILVQTQKDIRTAGGETNTGDGIPAPGENPLVLRVEGARGSMRAIILMPSGGLLEVHPGEMIGSVGRVLEVSAAGVRVDQKGQTHTLTFAAPRQAADDVSERQRAANGVTLPGTYGARQMTPPPVPLSQTVGGER